MSVLSPSIAFRGGEGLTPYRADCSADPLDLRPAADVIVCAAREALSKTEDDAPLVIIMGETHDIPTHIELEHLVASRLSEESFGRSMTVNLEHSHNILASIMKQDLGISVPSGLTYRIGEGDPDGSAVLTGYIAYRRASYAPEALHDLMDFCYHSGLATQFNDVAKDGNFLDRRDPLIKGFAAYRGLNINTMDISGSTPDAMAVRNRAMVSRALSHARQEEARIILQFTGLAHVFGRYFKQEKYGDSLCAAFHAAGAHVLPVFITTRADNSGVNILPYAAQSQLPHSVIVDGLAEEMFYAQWYAGWKGHPFTPGAEADFIRRVHEKSGGELEFFDRDARWEDYAEAARTHAVKVMDRLQGRTGVIIPQGPGLA